MPCISVHIGEEFSLSRRSFKEVYAVHIFCRQSCFLCCLHRTKLLQIIPYNVRRIPSTRRKLFTIRRIVNIIRCVESIWLVITADTVCVFT